MILTPQLIGGLDLELPNFKVVSVVSFRGQGHFQGQFVVAIVDQRTSEPRTIGSARSE